MNSSSGATSYMKASDDEAVIQSGDALTVRVEPIKDSMPLQFDKSDNVDSQQTVKLVFLKNSLVVRVQCCTSIETLKITDLVMDFFFTRPLSR